jgi:hypothetical protein
MMSADSTCISLDVRLNLSREGQIPSLPGLTTVKWNAAPEQKHHMIDALIHIIFQAANNSLLNFLDCLHNRIAQSIADNFLMDVLLCNR